MNQKVSFLRIFLPTILVVLLTVGIIFTIQINYVYKHFIFEWYHIFAPLILSMIIGSLLSSLLYFRKRLKYKNRLMNAVVDMAPELSCIEELDGRFSFVSQAAEKITGYPPQAFYDDPDLFRSLILDEYRDQWQAFHDSASEHSGNEPLEIKIRTKEDKVIWLEYYCSAIFDEDGQVSTYRSTSIDISKRKKIEHKIRMMAEYDPLTELPNRRHMHEWIDELIRHSSQYHSSFAVLFVDLDRFKHINDTHGHSLGDKLLYALSSRLKEHQSFEHFISRFGGDEFIIVIPDIQDNQEVERKAEKLLEIINEEFVVSGFTLNVDASIGIACYPQHGKNVEALIKNADTAMYHAKRHSANNIGFFQHTLFENSSQFLQIEHELRQAIKNNVFTLYYQPQFDLKTMEISGAESLARWLCEDGRPVMSPAEFIPVAEETGLILPLGKTLLSQLLEQMGRWQQQGLNLKTSLNVSAMQFTDYNFFDMLIDGLKAHSIPKEKIEIEITENVLLKETQQQLDLIERLKSEHISIALDDFGTGYSSISYLRNLSSNILKIDKKFIDTINASKNDRNLVQAIISLAHSFGMQVVAEGIETQEQLDILRELDCDYGQGYIYAQPMPAEAFERFYYEKRETSLQ